MPLIIIIFGVLLVLTIVIIAVHKISSGSHLSQTCNSDSDCYKGYKCIQEQCVPIDGYSCKIDPPTELKQCECPEIDENGRCLDQSGCSKCINNNPAFSCIQVSDKFPYSWQQNNKKIPLPNSPQGYGWCLPNIVNSKQCNPYTSEPILADIGNNEYEWGCYCKYPNLFGNSNTLNNCDFVYACASSVGEGGEKLGSLMVPTRENKNCNSDTDCGPNNMCLNPLTPIPCGYDYNTPNKHVITKPDCKTLGTCVCHTEWINDYTIDTNPLKGQCVCNKLNDKQLDYECVVRSPNYFEMNCVKGYCSVDGASTIKRVCNDSKDTNCCDPNKCFQESGSDSCLCCSCPDGYIQCPDQITSGNQGLILYCQESGPTCIKDPCSTNDVPGGYWDGKSCVCGTGYVAIEDENSAVGMICADPCSGNGPCGNRGCCYFPEDGKSINDAHCCNCVCPFTNENDSTCTCSGKTKAYSGEECCNDSDCCSGNCTGGCVSQGGNNCDNGKCGNGTDDNGNPTTFTGTCAGDNVITSKCNTNSTTLHCDAPTEDKCIPTPPTSPITCDDGSSCPYDTLCCKVGTQNSYKCCPYNDGTCCDDGLHCCPSTHPKCNSKTQMCTTQDDKNPIPWTGLWNQ